jgi:Transposase
MLHANKAVDEVRRAEFFRKGGRMRSVVKGKRWLLLNQPFALKREVMMAYLLKESPERLWTYTYEGAMLRYLKSWTLQLRWQPYRPLRRWLTCWWTIWRAS